MTGFLDLPPELRVMIYDYVLPTKENPETLVFNPKLDAKHQPFLSLWNICDQITSEIPEAETLVAGGALLPTLNVDIEFITEGCPWERGLEKLLPYLKSADSFHIQGPRFSQGGRSETDFELSYALEDSNASSSWNAWLMDSWEPCLMAHEALHLWLPGKGHNSRNDSKTLVIHVGYADSYYNDMLPLFLTALEPCCIHKLTRVAVDELVWSESRGEDIINERLETLKQINEQH